VVHVERISVDNHARRFTMVRFAQYVGSAVIAVVVAGFFLRPSTAQVPAGETVVLTGARVIDGTGKPPVERATVIIRNGRVSEIGPSDKLTIPAGAARVDLAGKTVMPGLINAHAHLNVDAASKAAVRDQLIQRLRMYAAYGVTTAYSLGSTQADELEGIKLRDEQERGALEHARLYTSGLIPAPKTPEDARTSVARNAGLKVDIVKLRLNGTPTDMTPDVYGALIDEAHKRNLRTAVHVFYLKDAKGAVEKGADILAHSVRDQEFDQPFLAELRRRTIGYIPTLTRDLSVFVYETRPAFFDDPFFTRGLSLYGGEVAALSEPAMQEKTRSSKQAQDIKQALRQASRNLKLAADAGVPVAMGTDSGAANTPGRWQGFFEHTELAMMVEAGLTPAQAIVAATGTAARVMRLPAVGTLEPGKWADLLVLNADPMADIRNTRQIHSVWIGGRRLANLP
jgi:imidazolonepropionase-like amidohydrolase